MAASPANLVAIATAVIVAAACYVGSSAATDPPPCVFGVPSDDVDADAALAINRKCRKVHFKRIASKYGQNAVGVDDRKCGVTAKNGTEEAVTADEVTQADICYSGVGEGVKKSFMHQIQLPKELYYDDYEDVKKTRFKIKREALENAYNSLLVSSMDPAWKFDRATVMALDPVWSDPDKDGIKASALIQFGSDAPTAESYKAAFLEATANDTMGDFKLERSDAFTDVVEDPPACLSTPEEDFGYSPTDEDGIPQDMWESSGGDAMAAAQIATTVSFTCPTDLWLSDDNDGFDAFDNQYTILCTALKRYKTPRKWPRCVPACERAPPAAPPDTGLEPVEAKIKVSAGQEGSYVCTDRSLGVERGGSEYYRVQCVADEGGAAAEYELPPADDSWPQCLTRTTTYSPVIPVAVDEMLANAKVTLERRMAIQQYEEGFEVNLGEDWFNKMFIPAAVCLAFLIMLICCLCRNDSPAFKVCADKNPYLRQQ